MHKRLALALVLALIFNVAPVFAGESVTKDYGDWTSNGWFWLDPEGQEWDLTKCDLTLSYQLDMSDYIPPAMWQTAWSSVGVGGGAWGWMSSGAPNAAETNPNSQDIDDKLNLGAPNRYDESSYDVLGDSLVAPPIGNPWANYSIWFDRDGVDPWQADNWGMKDGITYNTGGIYNIVVTYHAISSNLGTMVAKVNGEFQGFYDVWTNGPPDRSPVGKSISGELTQLRVFAALSGENVRAYGVQVTGCPYWTQADIDIKPGSYPNSINLKSKGVVPVAVLTNNDLDVTTIDPATVLFAGASPLRWTTEDVDGDGDLDLLFHFKTQELALDTASTEATLTGETTTGQAFRGTDTVNIVPKK